MNDDYSTCSATRKEWVYANGQPQQATVYCLKDAGHDGKHRFTGKRSRRELRAENKALTERVELLERQVQDVSRRAHAYMDALEQLGRDVQAARTRAVGSGP